MKERAIDSSSECSFSVNDLGNRFLSGEFKNIKSLNNCFNSKDTVIYSEDDETIKWPGKVFFRNNKLIFMLETNWKNQTKISRIVIYDSSLYTVQGFHVGSLFGEIKRNISKKFPNTPDGYLLYTDLIYNKINYN